MHPDIQKLIDQYENEIHKLLVTIPRLRTGKLQLMSGGKDISEEHADSLTQTMKELRAGIDVLKGLS